MRLRDDQPDDPDRDPVRVVHAAIDAGVRMIDTADLYDHEELVGRAVRSRRDEIVLASKFAVVWRENPADGYDIRTDPAYVRQACEASLRRLGVDHLDLYYVHHRSETVPIEDTVTALAELIDQGKIGAIGLSNVTAEDLRGNDDDHRPLRALLDEVARAHDTTTGQVALAWVHHRSRAHRVPVVPLPGTTRVSHLRHNLEAADLSLSPDALRRLDDATRP